MGICFRDRDTCRYILHLNDQKKSLVLKIIYEFVMLKDYYLNIMKISNYEY